MSKGAMGAVGAIGNAVSKGGGKGGQTFDPMALGQAQLTANVGTAEAQAALNNINTFSPFGSSVYTPQVDPATGRTRYDLSQTLSPELQNLFGTQSSLSQVMAGQGHDLVWGGRGQALRGFDIANNWVSPTIDLSAVPN